jgi:hypothetical protein
MRTALISIIVALFVLSGSVMAQSSVTYSFANERDDGDTVIAFIHPLNDVGVFIETYDTSRVTVYTDYRTGGGPWTVLDTTTVNSNVATSAGIVIRGQSTNLAPAANSLRFRIIFIDDAKNDAQGGIRIHLFRRQ